VLSRPPHIDAASIASTDILYPWDEWQVEKAYTPADPQLVARMARISHRGNVGMCIAMAEWVVWRFEGLSNDPVPLQYLEAAWAANVHTAYARYIETDDDEWRGVVRGPLNIAITIVINLIWGKDENEPGDNVGWMSKLAELVLVDAEPFRQWRDGCIERLEQHCPRSPNEEGDIFGDDHDLGPWVPRELFDLSLPFDSGDARTYTERFIQSLDYRANPFLHTPDEMRAFGDYEDTPYQLPAQSPP
jgi:hypothetical protein